VTQVNATKTKIYIPLTAGLHDLADSVNTIPGSASPCTIGNYACVDTAPKSASFTQTTPSRYPIWRKDTSKYVTLDTTTPWTFDVVGGASSGAGFFVQLFNKTTSTGITASQVTNSAGTIALASISFADNAADFTNGNDISVQSRQQGGAGGSVSYIFKAGLWVKLMGPLNQADVYYRIGRNVDTTSSTVVTPLARSIIDLTKFLVPTVYFEATGFQPSAGTSSISLIDHGSNDSGNAGGSTITGSTLNLSTTNARSRSSALSITSGDRYIPSVNVTSGSATMNSGFVIINAQ